MLKIRWVVSLSMASLQSQYTVSYVRVDKTE